MAAVGALAVYQLLRTWTKLVDVFVALTEFGRMKLVEAGFPPGKIVVKPNFVHPDPGVREDISTDYALFAGRLSPGRRILTLLHAWEKIVSIPLLIVGGGEARNLSEILSSTEASTTSGCLDLHNEKNYWN